MERVTFERKKPQTFSVAFYDLEIGTDPKVVGWNNHKNMEFACGCVHVAVYSAEEGEWRLTTEVSHAYLDVDQFAQKLNSCDLVVGFNNIAFDDRLITAHAGKDQDFLIKRFDIYDDLVARTGIKFVTGLDELAKTTIGEGKAEGISGELVPKMWQEGKRDEVVAYCKQDCKVLFDIFEFAKKYNYVLLQPNKNQDLFGNMVLKIPVDWAQVFPEILGESMV